MKHYCNRRVPKQNKPEPYAPPQNIKPPQRLTTAVSPLENNSNNENQDEILLPPGASYSMFYDAGILAPAEDYTEEAQGGSVTQGSGYLKETGQTDMRPRVASVTTGIPYDNMSGKFDFISIPKNNSDISMHTMTSFLDRYLGKFICLDLWTADCIREEICGILTETGRNFLVIAKQDGNKLTMVDLRSVRYINVYCR